MSIEIETSNNSYWMIKIFPFGVLVLGIALNLALGVLPIQVSMPSKELIGLLTCSLILLVINHSWIMTATELARNRFKIFATPEERLSSGISKSDVSEKGNAEIERHLNTHRNTTENIVYYIFITLVFTLISPSQVTAWIWILTFPIARLGYTYSYFKGNDNIRGGFMALTLLSVYGMVSYLALSFLFK